MTAMKSKRPAAEALADTEASRAEERERTQRDAWCEYRSLLERMVAGTERDSDGELLTRLADELCLTSALVERDTQLMREYIDNERRAADLPRLKEEHRFAHEGLLQARADSVAMLADAQTQLARANLAVLSGEHSRTECALIRKGRPELFERTPQP